MRCSFCGRSQRDAALFIPTIDGKGAICDNCIEQAHAMISQYIDTKTNKRQRRQIRLGNEKCAEAKGDC